MRKIAMRFMVVGAGGVGAYFGGRLAEAGHDVTFIARGATLEALRSQGLRVDSIDGDFRISPAQAANDPATVGAVDAVLVCVKAWQVPDAARALRPIVTPDTAVVPLQNGIDAPQRLIDVLGREPVLGGLCGVHAADASPATSSMMPPSPGSASASSMVRAARASSVCSRPSARQRASAPMCRRTSSRQCGPSSC
ncbi:MAG: 2-dehydropantoate 2-reductase N-terminal domain-containing protein [Burkholderiaceae bacterium]